MTFYQLFSRPGPCDPYAFLHTCILAYSYTSMFEYLHTCLIVYLSPCIHAYLLTTYLHFCIILNLYIWIYTHSDKKIPPNELKSASLIKGRTFQWICLNQVLRQIVCYLAKLWKCICFWPPKEYVVYKFKQFSIVLYFYFYRDTPEVNIE